MVKYLSDIKTGPTGKYFYVDLVDSTGEIRAMAFNSEADRLYNKLEVILFIINIIVYFCIKIPFCMKKKPR